MSALKFASDLFLEVIELQRMTDSLDKNGFRKNILQNSVNYGLIKSNADIAFANGHVTQDVDDMAGNYTVQVAPLAAIDNVGNFLALPLQRQIPIYADGNWHWLKAAYASSVVEPGTVSIDAAGNLVGVGTAFLSSLRGQPNFPSRIKFTDSTHNILEYDVLIVNSDTSAQLVHPAVPAGDPATFNAEHPLHYKIVGTFTPGIAPPEENKYPFIYDSATITTVTETIPNARPAYIAGKEFYIARAKVVGGTLVIQDKRIDYWETKGSDECIEITRTANPLIGVEAVKWERTVQPGDKNIVQVAWGMRSDNWSVNSSQNITTLMGSAMGGRYKSVADFSDGDFNGWRLYTPNGNYSRIIDSVKVGSAINLTLDVLDVDNYSTDGGTTWIAGTLMAAPDCDRVELQFRPDIGESIANCDGYFTFPVNTPLAECELVVYNDPAALYNLQYRYQSFKEFTQWTVIPSDMTVGYYTETSFDNDGNLKPVPDRVRQLYTTDPTTGFIRLTISDNAYSRFVYTIDRGDIFQVNDITSLSTSSVIPLLVGSSRVYQSVTGTSALSNDVIFNLQKTGVAVLRDYNIFEIHLNGEINLAGHNILIMQDYGLVGAIVLKTITPGDIYEMMNRDGGIYFRCTYSVDLGQWVVWQSYDLGQPMEIKMVPGSTAGVFDPMTGDGLVKGWYGWRVYNPLVGRVPIGAGSYTEGATTYTRAPGDTGGEVMHQLVTSEMPAHSHGIVDVPHSHGVTDLGHDHRLFFRAKQGSGGTDYNTIEVDSVPNANLPHHDGTGGSGSNTAYNELATTGVSINTAMTGITGTEDEGGDGLHNNMQPWLALTFAQKQY